MPLRETARDEYRRESGRYASDMTDREGALIEPFLPPERHHRRPRTTDLREVVNAVLYIATSGCQWRMPPRAFPPVSTVQRYFHDWRDGGLWQTIHFHLALRTREPEGREAQPTAGVPPLSHLRRRADIQDRDGAPAVPESIRQGDRSALPLAASRLRRQCPWWAEAARCPQAFRGLDDRDHQALRQGQGLRGSAAPLGRRAHLRMAGAIRQRLYMKGDSNEHAQER